MELPLPTLLHLLAAAVAVAAAIAFVSAAGGRGGRRRYHPVSGTVFHQLFHFGRLYHYQTELSRRHKTFRLFTPFNGEVYTNDPAVVEHILQTNFPNYVKGLYNNDTMRDLLGDGIFAVDGVQWRLQRKLASYEFSTRALRDCSGAVFKKNAARLAQAVSEAVGSRQAVDVQDLFMKSTMDSIFEVAFGIELNCLQGSGEETREFVRAFDESSALIMWRFINPFWKMLRFFNVGSEAKLRRNVAVLNDYVYRLIHAKIGEVSRRRREEPLSSPRKEDILSRFLVESGKDPTAMDDRYLRDIMLNFVIAGKDTTAGTLAWFFYMLCKHPPVQERIAGEVAAAAGADAGGSAAADPFGEFPARLTEAALAKMHYLHAAVSETLRLYPAVPMDSKICVSDDTLPDGYDVKRGDIVTYQPYAMGRMEYIWGEDAEVFRPERWLDAAGVFSPESSFKFTAFQAGPRICLGKEFAYRQMKIFAAVLLHFFTFRLAAGDGEAGEVNYRTMLTLHIDGGLRLRATPREREQVSG